MNSAELISLAKGAFTPNMAPAPFVIEKAEGSWIYDKEGNRYLDFSTGIAVNNLGHCHPKVVEAVSQQVRKLMHSSNMFWNEPAIRLAETLKKVSFADRVFLCNSGTEANEAKIKMARKYFYDQGKPRTQFICFKNSFHGRTLGSLSGTGQEKYWKGFEPLIPGFEFIPYNDLDSLNKISDQTAAVWLEPIQGEGGVFPAKLEFLKALRKRCDETGSLLMADEIQTGMGRTGSLFAMDFYGIQPDLMSLAKGLGGGLPIGAMLASEKVGASMTVGSHATTFGGNPVCASAALAVLDVLLEPHFFKELEKKTQFFWALLQEKIQSHPSVADLRGRGFMIGLELKQDITKIFEQLRAQKILVTRIPPLVLRILPPLTASREELTLFVEELRKALDLSA